MGISNSRTFGFSGFSFLYPIFRAYFIPSMKVRNSIRTAIKFPPHWYRRMLEEIPNYSGWFLTTLVSLTGHKPVPQTARLDS